jgi:tRNA A-37 threonylcarbamoyl transferase component Bud32/energy-coupling factor transporter ATP-binding protein EcfA2
MAIERPSQRHYPCFFCLDARSTVPNCQCENCGKPLEFGNQLIDEYVDGFKLEKYVGRGHYGAVFKARNRIGREYALKLVPVSLYTSAGKEFDEEISKFVRLGQHNNIASLEDAGTATLSILGSSISFYFIVMEWVEGVTLTEFTKEGAKTPNEIISVLFDVSAALERFESNNLWHNDLNSDNILIQKIDGSQSLTRKHDSPYICKIVDTGSAVFRGVKDKERLSDLKFLAFHINELRKASLGASDTFTREEQFLLAGISILVSRLFDENEERSIVTAKALSVELESTYSNRLLLTSAQLTELSDPFGYLNASEFPDDFISPLFSRGVPWIQSISSAESKNTLITGPRGCGKTMLLRSMSLNTRSLPNRPDETIDEIKERLAADGYIAFFVSARIEIGNHCSLSKLPEWANSEELCVLYFSLLFVNQILETVEHGQVAGIWHTDANNEGEFCNFIAESLGVENYGSISALASQVKKLQHKLVMGELSGEGNSRGLGPNFFSQISSRLVNLCPEFAGKEVVYLLDDFSKPKVPQEVQKSLLPIIFNIGGGYSFRVSAHSESTEKQDVRGNKYEINREYREINLGGSYLEATASTASLASVDEFIEDIFTRRFEHSKDLQGTKLVDLLGNDDDGPIGERLKKLHKEKAARTFRYHGRNTILKLCSGDISYLIDMVGKIARVKRSPQASVNTQHSVIRQYAWKELYGLKDISPQSNIDLYQVALTFGKFSRFKLISSRKGKSSKAEEYLKIEVELDQASDEVVALIADLLQHGVFVDGGFSNSSKGLPARKLFFRKIFTPAFPTSYNSGHTVPMTAPVFSEFAKNPVQYLRRKIAEDGVEPGNQLTLLDQLAHTVDPDET